MTLKPLSTVAREIEKNIMIGATRGGAGGSSGSGSEECVVRFKAGKCETENRENGKVWIKPLSRRGEVQVLKIDSVTHFQWRDRTSLAVDDDHMVFPGDASFERIGAPEDRVYLLQFGPTRRFFYWLQDKDDDNDQDNVAKVNSAMNGTSSESLSGFLRRMREEGNDEPAPSLTIEGVENVLQNLGLPPRPEQQQQQQQQPATTPPLSLSEDILTPAAIESSGILDDPATVDRLLQHLPEDQRTPRELAQVSRTPQFRQALTQLAGAVRNPDNAASIYANFGLQPSGTESDPARAFLDAVQASASQSGTDTPADDERQNDDAEQDEDDGQKMTD